MRDNYNANLTSHEFFYITCDTYLRYSEHKYLNMYVLTLTPRLSKVCICLYLTHLYIKLHKTDT